MNALKRLFSLGMLLVVLLAAASVAFAIELPASPWYAVTWVPSTDRLHWITPAGEQASISRPQMPGETGDLAQTTVRIAPNGRQLVMMTPLNSGRWGIGFYDLATGQWIQTHEAQPDEGPAPLMSLDFTTVSGHFATVLRNQASGDWRILVFETATGNAVAQLNRTDAFLPQTFYSDTNWHPVIASFGIDEGLGTLDMRLQHVSIAPPPYYAVPSFRWYPLPPPVLAAAPVVPDVLLYTPLIGLDVFKTTGQVVIGTFDSNQGAQPSPSIGNRIVTLQGGQAVPSVLVSDDAYTLNNPQWLRGNEWVGYRVQNDGLFQPHFAVTTAANGGDGLPLGPNIGAIHGTPDGFVAVDALAWRLYHATDLTMEGFAAVFGTTVFESGQPFSVIYVTPEGATFGLTTLATPIVPPGLDIAQPGVASPTPGLDIAVLPTATPSPGLDMAAPVDNCPGAPAPRMIPGAPGMVSFTNGQALNLRSTPAGAISGQLPEGTVFAVMNVAPQCVNGYLWWNLQLNNASTYWAAEGDNDGYFMEPHTPVVPNPPLGFVPTATPTAQLGILVLPTATPQLGIQAVPTATPTAQLGILVAPAATNPPRAQTCPNSPPARLSVGGNAFVSNNDGTLAMYPGVNDAIPTQQLPYLRIMSVIGGPQCREASGTRMWQVSVSINGQQVIGWVSEGFGGLYYVQPGLPA
ncbi:MAG: hypothetical protein KME04_17050 [Pleurocapsa minor GSE-CHR-MK-17-07R]|jgi:hypothetical protein|nr:hypothetical protein [Pleurocapsa minor GSE-CHR-MK 17-07R]